jgi:hypothetical protein
MAQVAAVAANLGPVPPSPPPLIAGHDGFVVLDPR